MAATLHRLRTVRRARRAGNERKSMEARNAVAVTNRISSEALDQLFREARTYTAWLPGAVPLEVLREAYELARIGPTSANSSPGRFVFLTTTEAKNRLLPALAPGN